MNTSFLPVFVSSIRMRSFNPSAFLLLGAFCLGLSSPASLAQVNHVWDGGGANDNLNNADNWDSDTQPMAGDSLTWNGTASGAITALLTGDLFGGPSSGLASITVTAGQASALNISNNSGQPRTLRMAADGSFTIASGAGAVTLGGATAWGFSIAGNGVSNFTFANNSGNAATIGSVVTINRGGSSGTRGLIFGGTGDWNVGATIGANLVTLEKSGAGTLTYSGATAATALGSGVAVSDGALIVTGTLSNASSAVTVSSGATLAGTGMIAGATTLAAGSFLDVGVTGDLFNDLTFSSTLNVTGATVSFNLDSGTAAFGRIVANGVTLGGATLSLTDLGGAALSNGTTFTLIDNTAAGSIGGTFAGLNEGASFMVGLNTYVISYAGGTGNDVTLTVVAIPEPASTALLLSGGMALLVLGRREKRFRK